MFTNLTDYNAKQVAEHVALQMNMEKLNYQTNEAGFVRNFLHSFGKVVASSYGSDLAIHFVNSGEVKDAPVQLLLTMLNYKITEENVVQFMLDYLSLDNLYSLLDGDFVAYMMECVPSADIPYKEAYGEEQIVWTCPYCSCENSTDKTEAESEGYSTYTITCENCYLTAIVEV